MKRYMRRPESVEAVQYIHGDYGDALTQLLKWCGRATFFSAHDRLVLSTSKGGSVDVNPGEWIIRTVDGNGKDEFTTCKPDVFAALFQEEPKHPSPLPPKDHQCRWSGTYPRYVCLECEKLSYAEPFEGVGFWVAEVADNSGIPCYRMRPRRVGEKLLTTIDIHKAMWWPSKDEAVREVQKLPEDMPWEAREHMFMSRSIPHDTSQCWRYQNPCRCLCTDCRAAKGTAVP